jgi:hypothetical protein
MCERLVAADDTRTAREVVLIAQRYGTRERAPTVLRRS